MSDIKTTVENYLGEKLVAPPNGLENGLFPNVFSSVVGQHYAKKRLEFYLRSYAHTKVLPTILLTGQVGGGKTRLAEEIAKGLYEFDDNGNIKLVPETKLPKRKSYLLINCADLTTIDSFIDTYLIPFQDRYATFTLDECGQIPEALSMVFLSLINPNQTKTVYNHNGVDIELDRSKISLIFCTSEPNKIQNALFDRLRGYRIDLQEYSVVELMEIIKRGSPNIQYNDEALKQIAEVSRGNARDAMHFASEVKTYLHGDSGSFTMNNWEELKDILSIFPMGLIPSEIALLKILKDNPNGISLTALSARTSLSRSSIRNETETMLQKKSFMTIDLKRKITQKGLAYLRLLPAEPV
jgi:Holliday junction resolvasome RuvABC ATP-dependent DNA helicase subunit